MNMIFQFKCKFKSSVWARKNFYVFRVTLDVDMELRKSMVSFANLMSLLGLDNLADTCAHTGGH